MRREPSAPRSVDDALLQLMTAVETYRQRAASHAGLRGSESHAVLMINHAGSLSQIQLAEQLGMTSGATTGLVDRLERAGIVERIRDRSDRRRNQVRLTPVGLQLVDDDRARLDQVLAGVPDDDLPVFRAQLITMVEHLAELAAQLGGEQSGRPIA